MEELIINQQPPLNHIFTLNEVLAIFGDQLISSMLITNILFLVLAIAIHQYSIRYWNLPLWTKIDWNDTKTVLEKSLTSFAMICIPISLGFTVMLVAYLYGVTI